MSKKWKKHGFSIHRIFGAKSRDFYSPHSNIETVENRSESALSVDSGIDNGNVEEFTEINTPIATVSSSIEHDVYSESSPYKYQWKKSRSLWAIVRNKVYRNSRSWDIPNECNEVSNNEDSLDHLSGQKVFDDNVFAITDNVNFANDSNSLDKISVIEEEIPDNNKHSADNSQTQSNSFKNVIEIKIPSNDEKTSEIGDSNPTTPTSSTTSSSVKKSSIPTPGLTGIHNLGNSCYINSIIQCLAHIDLFNEYFVKQTYKHEVSKRKYKDPGAESKQELVSVLSKFLKTLWNDGEYTVDICREFHNVVQSSSSFYNSTEQQDAHEFLMWIIEKVHEEIVRVPKKRNKDLIKKHEKLQDEESAVIAFASYTRYSQSYIQGLFLSQYRSSIKCTKCQKSSSKFDPYTCLSLSIPKPKNKPVYVNYRSAVCDESIRLLAFDLPRTTLLVELKNQIKTKTGIAVELVELDRHGALNVLRNDETIEIISENLNSVYALAVNGDVNNENAKKVTIISNNVIVNENFMRSFDYPVAISMDIDCSFKKIQQALRKHMFTASKKELSKLIKSKTVKFGLRIVHPENKLTEENTVNPGLKFPLHADYIMSALQENRDTDELSLFMIAEWEPEPAGWYMDTVVLPEIREEACFKQVYERYRNQQPTVDIEECLQLQTQEEKLPEDSTWTCGLCNTKQQGITKKMTLWSLPDLLVIHLKRFEHNNQTKIQTRVMFPVESLNLAPHVTDPSNNRQSSKKKYNKESLRMNYMPPPQSEEECVYDLVAVCNHLGTHINSGHYTATCYNSADQCWYQFDDRKVSSIDAKDIATPGAYLLFYQRRQISRLVPADINQSVRSVRQFPALHWALAEKQQQQNPSIKVVEDDTQY